jgi:hypothetical protein
MKYLRKIHMVGDPIQTVVQSKSLVLQGIEDKERCQEGRMTFLNEEVFLLLAFPIQHMSISEVQSRSPTMMTVLMMGMYLLVEKNILPATCPLKDHSYQNIHCHHHQS